MIPNGLSAFPLTPADANGVVDVTGLSKLVTRLAAAGVDSIGLLGSTGNYAYLNREERRRAVEAAVMAAQGVPVVAGVGALRTDDAVNLARDAKAAGAAAGLLAPMSYTPLTDEEVYAHFRAVAEESALPICIYDNPGTTHFTFSPELVGRISRLPGVIAVKSPAPAADAVRGHLSALQNTTKPGFSLGYSVDWTCTEALIAGADVWYSVLGGTCPEVCLRLVRAVQAGDHDEARRIDTSLGPIWTLFRQHSSLRVVFAMANLMGLTDTQPPRPILPVSDEVKRELRQIIDQLDLS